MVFTSALFMFLFLPVFAALYFAAKKGHRNYFLLLASFIFYFWAEPKFVFIVLLSILFDWYMGNRIFAEQSVRLKKIWLTLAVLSNVLLLVYFKYMNFSVDNVNQLLLHFKIQPLGWTKIALPLGLSFIVFEKITYSVDIYRGIGKPAKKLGLYALYVLLFPKLIAGPIVKYHDISDQLEQRKEGIDTVLHGILRFSIGLAKKVWIANTLSTIVDKIFLIPPESLNIQQAWLGIICFTFQIYFDFSGYTDMAIGLARMAGFTLKENFNYPYISASFTEFWRRWHISLSTWIKEYLYIPLGGNRGPKARTYFNLWFCFFISGLWHGANWTYVIWGVYHGFFLVMDKLFWLDLSKKLSRIVTTPLTFLMIVIGWVIFRAPTMQYAAGYLERMFDLSHVFTYKVEQLVYVGNDVLFCIAAAFLVSFLPLIKKIQESWDATITRAAIGIRPLAATSFFLVTVSIIKISTSHFAPFIYFRF